MDRVANDRLQETPARALLSRDDVVGALLLGRRRERETTEETWRWSRVERVMRTEIGFAIVSSR